MSKFFMSADGGGSKMSVVLFDEKANLHGFGISGPINPRFVSNRIIRDNFISSIEQCLSHLKVDEIETLYISMPGPTDLFAHLLSKRTKLIRSIQLSEGEMSLLAGMFCEQGLVALAGTGSGVFNVNGVNSTHVGGWGALFDDEGSGYSIGAAAIRAAVQSFDHRSSRTKLEDAIVEKLKLNNLRKIVEYIYESEDYRGIIASLTKTVVEVARSGDTVAQSILQKAGHDMARQVITIIKRDNLAPVQKVMIAGSVWKGNSYMFEAFVHDLHSELSQVKIVIPAFEAVVGGAIKTHLELNGSIDENTLNCINKSFKNYVFRFS